MKPIKHECPAIKQQCNNHGDPNSVCLQENGPGVIARPIHFGANAG
jgi:hypothetical protein